MTSVFDIIGIGAVYAGRLQEIGIHSASGLLMAGGDQDGRDRIASETGICKNLLLNWVCRADLTRIYGVNHLYADLLANAGLTTVPMVAAQRPDNLHNIIYETNDQINIVNCVPSLSIISNWVSHARLLPGIVNY